MRYRKISLILVLVIVLAIAAFYIFIKPNYVVPILMYHHIDERGKLSSLSVSPENFRKQMRFLSRSNYNVISLKEFVQAKEKREKLPPSTVVITFDDGYEDNYYFAYPALKKYNFPAAIFVIIDTIGEEGYLNFAQLKELASSEIIDIGSHTISGNYLPGKNRRQLAREIGGSKEILQRWLNEEVDFFCYPIGGFSFAIRDIVKRSGYKAACTTNRGTKQTYLNDDIFALKRIKIKDGFNSFVFWTKLSGYYNLFRRVREPY